MDTTDSKLPKSTTIQNHLRETGPWPSDSLRAYARIAGAVYPHLKDEFLLLNTEPTAIVRAFVVDSLLAPRRRGPKARDAWIYDVYQGGPKTDDIRAKIKNAYAAWIRKLVAKSDDERRLIVEAFRFPLVELVVQEGPALRGALFFGMLPACERFLKSLESPDEGIGAPVTAAMMGVLNHMRYAKPQGGLKAYLRAGGKRILTHKTQQRTLNRGLWLLCRRGFERADKAKSGQEFAGFDAIRTIIDSCIAALRKGHPPFPSGPAQVLRYVQRNNREIMKLFSLTMIVEEEAAALAAEDRANEDAWRLAFDKALFGENRDVSGSVTLGDVAIDPTWEAPKR